MRKNKIFIKKILLVFFVIVFVFNIYLVIQEVKEKNIDTRARITIVQILRNVLNKNIVTNKNNSCISAKLGSIYFKKKYYKYAKQRFVEVLKSNSTVYPCHYERIILEKYHKIINIYNDNRTTLPKIITDVYKPLITIYLAEGKTQEANLFLQMSNKILADQKYETITNEELKNEISNEHILALPYLQYSTEITDKNKIGVVTYNKEFTYEGYISYGDFFWDMEGNIFSLFGIENYNSISNQIIPNWTPPIIMQEHKIWHHDFYVLEDKSFITIISKVYNYTGKQTKFDEFVHFNEKEEEISRWSTYDHLSAIQNYFDINIYDLESNFDSNTGLYDYFHANSIQVLPETDIGRKDRRFQEGNWLISLPKVNLVLIIDKNTKELVWSFGPGKLRFQHSPRMLDNGNIIIFDNGIYRNYSRVIEIDPLTEEIVWEYKGSPPESFFSLENSNAQRLPNGNTLITEGIKGRVFEVTPKKEIVWEFYNPRFDEKGHREKIYRAFKLEKKEFVNLKEEDVLTLFEKVFILITSSVD